MAISSGILSVAPAFPSRPSRRRQNVGVYTLLYIQTGAQQTPAEDVGVYNPAFADVIGPEVVVIVSFPFLSADRPSPVSFRASTCRA